jgi:flagellar biosynthesis chaperone FliJ
MKIKEIQQTIKMLDETIKRYKSDLEKNPDSTFYAGLVKNTEKYILELTLKLKNKKDGN